MCGVTISTINMRPAHCAILVLSFTFVVVMTTRSEKRNRRRTRIRATASALKLVEGAKDRPKALQPVQNEEPVCNKIVTDELDWEVITKL